MCGIFGIIATERSKIDSNFYINCIDNLFKYSESRGQEASGISIRKHNEINVLKSPQAPSDLIKSEDYKYFLDSIEFDENGNLKHPTSFIGHSRLVTDGSQENHNNNQPLIKDGTVCIHNGIVTNVNDLWIKNPSFDREFEIDTEIIPILIRKGLHNKLSITDAVINTFNEIYGMTSIAMFFDDMNLLLLATNNGSLYTAQDSDSGLFIFASEEYILKRLSEKRFFKKLFRKLNITKINPGNGNLVNTQNINSKNFSLLNEFDNNHIGIEITKPIKINDIKPKKINYSQMGSGYKNANKIKIDVPRKFIKEFDNTVSNTRYLKRCKKCVLTETMPFINFNEEGICNYCRHYKPFYNKSDDDFRKLLENNKTENSKSNCIVAFSGGRDSSFGLHLLKKEYGLNPITFTYDWGMLTDLSRRNISRICGELGLENILVSADIKKKRLNIRKNIIAWLKNPQLGMIPLFMAGDKQFFYYVNQIKKQTGIRLNIWMANKFEETNFKVGFSGVSPDFRKDEIHQLFAFQKLKLTSYYLSNFIKNTKYLNSSIVDTIGAYFSYYFEKRDGYVNLFDYHPWDEEAIERVLIDEYNWELSPDTKSTWRIGDGTAPFYNYIYFTIAGFTENDTFRSNQIREGKISRELALEKVYEENNAPRWESIQWYCDTIGIDFKSTINKINQIPRLYQK